MSQLTGRLLASPFPLLAGAAVLRDPRAEQPLFAKASAGEAVAQLWQAPQDGGAGSYRQLRICRRSARICRARLAGMASPLRRRSGAQGRALSTLASPAGAAAARRSRRTDLSFAVRCAAAHLALRRCQPPRAVSGSFAMDGIILPAEKARRRARCRYRPVLAAAGGGRRPRGAGPCGDPDADLSAAHQAANA